ncbi:hypothetical protein HMPREF1544_03091 [Mucor circinelloides 1006PhL]|uniref:F-box domain-containing protein n=1 Tax=Mucor circinelloides f. circinelloides (strain 1006PhL) TaxID=1220926 RepID=S2KCS2_MUCC1|nr:hypothetical protein HMPREF1544_03091 [Mucor circinelloides 1006PhL]
MDSMETSNPDVMMLSSSSTVTIALNNKDAGQIFPERILYQLFQNLKQMDLAKCSLVCRGWYIAARPYLYRYVTLCSAKSFYSFSDCILGNSKERLGSLVREIHFGGSLHIRGWNFCRPIDIAKLLSHCPQLQSVRTSEIEPLKKSVVEVLARTPKANKYRYLAIIPHLLGDIYYKRCLVLFKNSLTEVFLGARHLTLSTLQRFPNLTKLHVEEISCQSITFYSLLGAVPSLQELSIGYPLNENHFLNGFPLKVFPSLRKLDLKFEISSSFHYLQVAHLLSFFTRLQSLSLSLTDGVNESLRLDQLYSIEEIVSLVIKLGNSCSHVSFHNKSFYLLNMPLYLQCILNAIGPAESRTKSSAFDMVFDENCYCEKYVRYSSNRITLPSKMSTDLVRNLLQRASLYLTTIVFVCRDTSSTFETNSARLLKTVLEECLQTKRLVLHGSSNFDCDFPILKSYSILEFQLLQLRFHFSMLEDAPFCFPHLQRILIQVSLDAHWKNDIDVYMPSNTLREFCIDVGDPNDCCITKNALTHALFAIDLEIRQSGKFKRLYFIYSNQTMRQIYDKNFEAIKCQSEIRRLKLVFQHLDVLLFKYERYSSKLWDSSLNF